MHESEREVTQSCPTLCDPMDCSPPGSSVHGILQARVLEWGAIAFSVMSCLFYHNKNIYLKNLFQVTLQQFVSLQSFMRTCTHLLLRELQNYNSLLNNHQQENVGSQQKKTPHVQGQSRSPRKIVGGVKSQLESNPITCQRHSEVSYKPCAHRTQRPHRD